MSHPFLKQLFFIGLLHSRKHREAILAIACSIYAVFLLSRKSWQRISMKAFFLFQMSGYMVRHLLKLITVLLYALSMLRTFILLILRKFLISRYAEVSTIWFIRKHVFVILINSYSKCLNITFMTTS